MPPTQPYEALAELVRSARSSREMSQRELSATLRMSPGYVAHLESGGIRPKVDTLKVLAQVLGLLFGELAVAAGYISREEFERPIDDRQLARLSEVDDLTDDEWESVRDFARCVRSRRADDS